MEKSCESGGVMPLFLLFYNLSSSSGVVKGWIGTRGDRSNFSLNVLRFCANVRNEGIFWDKIRLKWDQAAIDRRVGGKCGWWWVRVLVRAHHPYFRQDVPHTYRNEVFYSTSHGSGLCKQVKGLQRALSCVVGYSSMHGAIPAVACW